MRFQWTAINKIKFRMEKVYCSISFRFICLFSSLPDQLADFVIVTYADVICIFHFIIFFYCCWSFGALDKRTRNKKCKKNCVQSRCHCADLAGPKDSRVCVNDLTNYVNRIESIDSIRRNRTTARMVDARKFIWQIAAHVSVNFIGCALRRRQTSFPLS